MDIGIIFVHKLNGDVSSTLICQVIRFFFFFPNATLFGKTVGIEIILVHQLNGDVS